MLYRIYKLLILTQDLRYQNYNFSDNDTTILVYNKNISEPIRLVLQHNS